MIKIRIQRLLLSEKDLTYEKVLEITRSQEAASQNVQTIRGMQGRVISSSAQSPPIESINLLK